jgi:undecaprenyl-diphosphatase
VPAWLAVALLGLIEGVTEFLPVSSTGHLLLVENSRWLPRQSDVFNIVIQSSAALALIPLFARRIRTLLTRFAEPETGDYLLKLGAAFAVTGGGGLAMKRLGFALPEEAAPVAWATLLGGALILAVERWLRGRRLDDRVTWEVALAVGAAQLLAAAFPGTSRAGATILVALALGLSRARATEFSFLLGIPTLLAAGALELRGALRHPEPGGTEWGLLLLGCLVSFVAALLVVRWLLRFVQTHTFEAFGWYRIALGLLILAIADRP